MNRDEMFGFLKRLQIKFELDCSPFLFINESEKLALVMRRKGKERIFVIDDWEVDCGYSLSESIVKNIKWID